MQTKPNQEPHFYNSAAHELREIEAHYKEQNAPAHQLEILSQAIQHFEWLSREQQAQQQES